ncbi:bifunctional cytidylyltransferase/SDR family oxidoreductase [Vibrio panuliri]|uniref:2-C-methyl-D-erythritol 4-phosphate cytidylyltransferase n=2 Tax=Vibrio panuliri TaxID=1381081 RepID=A0ABX3FMJ0_9VIBR|nr:bifunctional cytidylyltransferase/SDR family oxidoreductase [Vibrio panuliri]KAB1457283.1 bifunctional cytidylyltransferase/SDR family oxidoreductase [Vibrio panuliri]OLQ94980.1 hypothetical protein BIY20_21575 [Vibrio panuliri]
MNIAVVLAGGVGSRFGKAYPKQFAKVAGKTLIEHTLDVFEINSDIDDVIVVSKGGFVDLIWEMVNKNGYHKIKSVISGGNERMDSTFNALEYIRDNYDATSDINLIIHDAVRPFVSDEIITACINELNIFDAVDVVINSADTIVEVDDDGNLVNIPERSKLRRGQTPQCFKFHVLYEAYVLAKAQENMKVTCDCGVLLQVMPHVKISTVHGHDTNIKITEPIDISIADYVFQQKGENRLSFLKKEELRNRIRDKVLVVYGGSYGIGQDIIDLANECGAITYSFSRGQTNTDISNSADIEYSLKKVFDNEGRIDFVINSAALLKKKPLMNMSDSEIKNIIDVNLYGAILLAKKAFPYLKQTQGAMLNFTSSSYTRGRSYYSSYCSSKAGVVNLTQSLAEEWYDFNVKVNCINPERTSTPMRRTNFGHEDPTTLLKSEDVAVASLNTLVSLSSGHIVNVKFDNVLERNEYFNSK